MVESIVQISLSLKLNSLTALMGLSVVMYTLLMLLQYLLLDGSDGAFNLLLYLFGGLRADWALADGEVWRLVTTTFLHANILHLGLNMFVLSQLGNHTYNFYGGKLLVVFYVICGIAGSLASIVLAPFVATVGASGAIFGLIGVLIGGSIKRTPYGVQLPFRLVDLLPFVIINLVIGFAPGLGINNWAHLGGLLAGLILGLLFHNKMTAHVPRWEKVAGGYGYYLSVAVIVLSFVGIVVSALSILTA